MLYEELIPWLQQRQPITYMIELPSHLEPTQTTGISVKHIANMQHLDDKTLLLGLQSIRVHDFNAPCSPHPIVSPERIPSVCRMIVYNKARSMIAAGCRRGRGNTLVPCRDGCLILYIGESAFDTPVAYDAGSYAVVGLYERYFAFIQGDPVEIERAAVEMHEIDEANAIRYRAEKEARIAAQQPAYGVDGIAS